MDFYENPKYSVAIYKILKIIDVGYENQNFSFKCFDLKKLEISEHRLELILLSLYNSGLIDGVKEIPVMMSRNPKHNFDNLFLTLEGMLFLEENSSMKNAYKILREVRDWLPV